MEQFYSDSIQGEGESIWSIEMEDVDKCLEIDGELWVALPQALHGPL